MEKSVNIFWRLALWASILTLLGGCAGVDIYMQTAVPQITAEQEAMVGAAAQKRLIQILGGHYHDKALAARLKRLGKEFDCQVAIADRSAVESYSLPGCQVIITRGLLTWIDSSKQLEGLLKKASDETRTAHADNAGYTLNRATREFLSADLSRFNPDAADIKIARVYADNPCDSFCLEQAYPYHSTESGELPVEVEQLKKLQPGYALLASASKLEKSGEQRKAISTYLQAATDSPDEPRILGALGMAYLRAGELQSARLHLQKAHKLQPDYYKTKMGLGYLYMQKGKIERANTLLADSVKLLPVTENLFLLAEAQEKIGNSQNAFDLYRRVVEHDRYSKLGRTAAKRLKEAKGFK